MYPLPPPDEARTPALARALAPTEPRPQTPRNRAARVPGGTPTVRRAHDLRRQAEYCGQPRTGGAA